MLLTIKVTLGESETIFSYLYRPVLGQITDPHVRVEFPLYCI